METIIFIFAQIFFQTLKPIILEELVLLLNMHQERFLKKNMTNMLLVMSIVFRV